MTNTATLNPILTHAGYEQKKWNTINELGLQAYCSTIPNLHAGFQEHTNNSCGCIDEGIRGGKVRLAGSGILHPQGAGAVAELLNRAGVATVTSHEGCGAAALFTQKVIRGELPEPDWFTSDPEQNAQLFSKSVVEKLRDLAPQHAHHQHIKLERMVRPRDLHIARAVYVDMTGRFNPAAVPELPLGFVVSQKYLSSDHTLADTNLSIQIGLGHHGLGEFFTTKQPFHIVIVSDPMSGSNELVALAELASTYQGRVQLDQLVFSSLFTA